MKFSFGHGIIAALGTFVVLMMGFFIYAMMEENDTVVPRAWEASLNYDRQMAWAQATVQQGKTPSIGLEGPMLRMDFGPSGQPRVGKLHLYRPSDASLDKHLPLRPDSAGLQVLPISSLQPGRWQLKLTWWAGRDTFAHEESLFLP